MRRQNLRLRNLLLQIRPIRTAVWYSLRPLPQPNSGRKEYQDEDGRVTKVYAWFGYKFHWLVDVRHEVVIAWHMTPATASDARTLPALLTKAQRVLPPDGLRPWPMTRRRTTRKLMNCCIGTGSNR